MSPNVAQNLEIWNETYDWSRGGIEWGDPDVLWNATAAYMDGFPWGGTTLEIGPGYGRLTQFLVPRSERLVLVDLAARCIEACRERFGTEGIEYHVNDGMSLAAIRGPIDVAFSHSSLVHAEQDVIDAYVTQLGTLLRPGGHGLLHHSRLADMDFNGYNQFFAETVGPTTVAEALEQAGLELIGQYVTTHLDGEPIGCISTFRRRE